MAMLPVGILGVEVHRKWLGLGNTCVTQHITSMQNPLFVGGGMKKSILNLGMGYAQEIYPPLKQTQSGSLRLNVAIRI